MGQAEPAVTRCEIDACANHGVIARNSAIRHGVSEDKIRRLVRSGRWIPMLPGALAPAAVPVTWFTRLAAAREWAGPDHVFSHRTAGRLLKLDGAPDGFIELALPRGKSAPDVVVHRLREGDRPRTIFVEGFRITNLERTLLDLFSVLSSLAAERALEDALRKRLTTLERLWDTSRTSSAPGRNGTKAFREALLFRDHRDGTLQSRMEARLLRILRDAPAPAITVQHEVPVDDERFFLDFAFPEVQLGIEAQSLRWHLGEVRWKRDMRRDRKLKRIGWTLLYYPWDDIDLRPTEVLDEILAIRRNLARATRLF